MFQPDFKSIPKDPGVYIYKNKENEIIYIGKAKDLRSRVSSYFKDKHENSVKTQFLVRNITNMEYLVVDNEVEALLLENKLIKKHKPKYNISLKDSKTYAYIKITDDEIPRIVTTRKVTKDGEYFGPFADGYYRILLIELVVNIFKLVTNKTYTSKSKLNYEIGKAPAPTEKEINKDDYLEKVKQAKEFLKGKNHKEIIKQLETEMKELSNKKQFEKALEKKKQIEAIESLDEKQKVDLIENYDQNILAILNDEKKALIQILKISRGVISGKEEFRLDYDEELFESFIKMYYSQNYIPREILVNEKFWKNDDKNIIEEYLTRIKGSKVEIILPQKGEKLELVKMAEKNARLNFGDKDILFEMQKKLGLSKLPNVIECFDMSNLGSQYLVGAMTCWVDGRQNRERSRKYEIKSFQGKNDDFSSMKEVIYRRYRMLRDSNEEFPDLIMVDGGKGQLNAALESLSKLNLDIPIISLAKREEEIYLPNTEEPLRLDKNSKMMLHIRAMRDSVHNYVLAYNRKKRDMRMRKEKEKAS